MKPPLLLLLTLALHFGDNAAALAAAERIRVLQDDPAERQLAGLATRAIVRARADTSEAKPAEFAAAFEKRL